MDINIRVGFQNASWMRELSAISGDKSNRKQMLFTPANPQRMTEFHYYFWEFWYELILEWNGPCYSRVRYRVTRPPLQKLRTALRQRLVH